MPKLPLPAAAAPKTPLVTLTAGVVATLAFALAPACGGSSGSQFDAGGGGGSGSGSGGTPPILIGGDDGGGTTPATDGGCVGLQCQIHACSGSTTGTTLTGHVYDPAGNNPLYNVVVYVPETTPSAITSGIDATSCSCDLLYTGEPIASGITDATGAFTVPNVPDGANIPLVVQIGKWRTQIKIPTVTPCGANNLDTLLPSKLTLPSKSGIGTTGMTKGLEQDIPNIAVSTGSADTLECLLHRIGVDDSEYTPGAGGTGHIHIFVGGGGGGKGGGGGAPSMPGKSTASDDGLWASYDTLKPYDIVLLSCEGSPTTISDVPTTTAALQTYTTAGGRAFAEHYHYEFFADTASVFVNDKIADWFNVQPEGAGGGNDKYDDNSVSAIIETTLPNGQPFPKGQALQTWLGSTIGVEVKGELPISVGRYNATVTGTTYVSTPWAQADPATIGSGKNSTQYFSFDTPIGGVKNPDGGAPNYCGRVVFSDLHVSGGSGSGNVDQDEGPGKVPTGCTTQKLQPDEDALEFMLFDLSSCVTPVGVIPQPPPTSPPPVK